MLWEDEYRLSCYRQVGWLDEPHGVALVQHTQTGRVYVKKTLTNFHTDIFRRLQKQPVYGMPVIREVIEDGSVLIIIEDYITGRPLSEILSEKGVISASLAVRTVRDVLVILAGLHAMQPPVIHRDIKPSNILLTDDGRTVLLDLDAAKWYDRTESRDTKLIGTKGYAAPEQYGFGPSSPQTDIYGVGVLLNVCLTGAFPQDRKAEGPLGAVVARCTALEPANRYLSAMDVVAALDRIVQGAQPEPVTRFAPAAERVPEHTPVTEGWQSWLPPGFRSRRPLVWILSAIGYILGLAITTGFDMKGYDVTANIVARVCTTAAFLLIVFFAGNWRGVHDKWFLTAGKTGYHRIASVFMTLVLIVIFFFIAMTAYGGFFSGNHVVP